MKEAEYYKLYKKLKEDIIAGIYSYGEKMPSKRTISEKMELSVITTAHAYDLLIEEGYIEARQRSGYFVIYKKADFSLEKNNASTIALSFEGQNGGAIDGESVKQSVSDEAISFALLSKVMRKVMLDYGEQILVKSPNLGCIELREQIRTYLMRSRGISVDINQIVISSGAEQLYGMISGLFSEEKVFGIEDPCYEKISMVYSQRGKKVEALALGANGIHTEALMKTKATVLHVTPFHSYPSGATADVSKKNEYLHWAKLRKAFIVEDNYDSELTVSHKAEEALFEMDDSDSVIYLNTFSKTISPSIRVGYMILPKCLTGKYLEKYGDYSCTVPVLEQLFLAELLRSGDFERHVNRIRRARRRNFGDRCASANPRH